jgi:hypothetical protein
MPLRFHYTQDRTYDPNLAVSATSTGRRQDTVCTSALSFTKIRIADCIRGCDHTHTPQLLVTTIQPITLNWGSYLWHYHGRCFEIFFWPREKRLWGDSSIGKVIFRLITTTVHLPNYHHYIRPLRTNRTLPTTFSETRAQNRKPDSWRVNMINHKAARRYFCQ